MSRTELRHRLEITERENTWLRAALQVAMNQRDEAMEKIADLRWIVERAQIVLLPMAKGYAAEHPVGNNAEMVADMEARLPIKDGILPPAMKCPISGWPCYLKGCLSALKCECKKR